MPTATFYVAKDISLIQSHVYVFDVVLNVDSLNKRDLDDLSPYYKDDAWYRIETNNEVVHRMILSNITDIEMTEPTNGDPDTLVRYLFGIGVNAYYKWTGSAWVTVGIGDIGTAGNTKTEIDAMIPANFAELSQLFIDIGRSDFHIIAGLKTNDDSKTPILDLITITYSTYRKCTDAELQIENIDSAGHYSTIKNISGGPLTDLVVYAFRVGNS